MYSDAGLGYNNPTMVAVQQAAYHFPGSRGSLRAVISVGTGHKIAREEGAGKIYLKNILEGLKNVNTAQADCGAREFFQRKPEAVALHPVRPADLRL